MRLTPWEEDRLLVFAAAELARRHRAAGIKLNAPEATALMCDAMFEAARGGAGYDEVLAAGREAVDVTDVMDGVAGLVDEIRLEVLLGDGTRLVVLRQPLGGPSASGFDRETSSGEVPQPPARVTLELHVRNASARAVRVSSHYPFHDVNPRLEFDRAAARGYRLDLPAGATERWAPGEERTVRLVRYGGSSGDR